MMVITKTAVGVGLRSFLYKDIIATLGSDSSSDSLPNFFEIHPENYRGGGFDRHILRQVRDKMPLSFHSIGLSLGSTQLPNREHLQALKTLTNDFKPDLFSDHVSWSSSGNAHLNDLLPIPYNQDSLSYISRNIDLVQTTLGDQMLVENPSSYFQLKASTYDEPSFLNELCSASGCALLLDINNIYVQSFNHNFCAYSYIDKINPGLVQEYHLAGHQHYDGKTCTLKIDTHDQYICDEVWDLYVYALGKIGFAPTLIEWDSNCPSYDALCGEVKKAKEVIKKREQSFLERRHG